MSTKLLASLIVRALDKPSAHLSKALTFEDRNVFDFLHWGNSSNGNEVRTPVAKAKREFKLPTIHPPAQPLFEKQINQIQAQNNAQDLRRKFDKQKDDKNRRKKRRKNLEKMAAKTPAQTLPPAYMPYVPVTDTPIAAAPFLPANQNSGGAFNNSPGGGTTTTTPQPTNPGTAPGVSKVNVDWYLQNLIKSQSPQLMRSFVQLFRTKQVSATDFFRVLDTLVKSNVNNLIMLAIGGASQAPSVPSFEALSDASFLTSDPAAASLALQSLASYQRASSANLSYLLGAIKGTDNSAQLRAMDALDAIITSLSSNTQGLQSAKTLLNPFVFPLQTIAAQANQPSLQAKATQTLQNLQSIGA